METMTGLRVKIELLLFFYSFPERELGLPTRLPKVGFIFAVMLR
jgi:hypothetical protein